jgi:hypothetical protein
MARTVGRFEPLSVVTTRITAAGNHADDSDDGDDGDEEVEKA